MMSLYESALDARITPEGFWEHSPGEIADMIRSHERQMEKELKLQISLNFAQADVIRRRLFPDKDTTEPPQPWDYFPALFAKEKESYITMAEREELEDFKARRAAFMLAHNKRIQMRGGESDVRS